MLYQEFKCMANKNNTSDRVYQNITIANIPVDNTYKQSFNNILRKDYHNKPFGFLPRIQQTLCLDIDKIETDNGGNNDNTMDLTIGIAKYDDTLQTFSSHRLLPVELKLDCKSFVRLRKDDLVRKDRHTRDILNGFAITTDSHSIFLFTEDVAPSAKSGKSRWEKGSNSHSLKYWEMMSPKEYNSYIQFKEDFPYKPITDVDSIKRNIQMLFSNGDIDRLIYFIDDCKNRAESYKRKYYLNECNIIANTLSESISYLMSNNGDADIEEYLSMLREDIESLKIQ